MDVCQDYEGSSERKERFVVTCLSSPPPPLTAHLPNYSSVSVWQRLQFAKVDYHLFDFNMYDKICVRFAALFAF